MPTSVVVVTGTWANCNVEFSPCTVAGLGLILAWISSSLIEHREGVTQTMAPLPRLNLLDPVSDDLELVLQAVSNLRAALVASPTSPVFQPLAIF